MKKRGGRLFGFALVELLLALALGLLLFGLGAVSLRKNTHTAGARGLADVVAEELRAARARARSTGLPVAVGFPSQNGSRGDFQALYVLEGEVYPKVIRSLRLGGDHPQSCLLVGSWPETSGSLTVTYPALAAAPASFNLAAWNAPYPQDPMFVFTPSGRVFSNGQPIFSGAYHLVACQGVVATPTTVGATATFAPLQIGSPQTISLSLTGECSVTSGLAQTTGSVAVVDALPIIPGALPPAAGLAADQPPTLVSVVCGPAPNATTLPTGMDATVASDGFLTLTVQADDPDGDPLYVQWRADGGTVWPDQPTRMEYDGAHWVATTQWTPPAGGAGPYTLTCTVDDRRGGTATGTLGSGGKVAVLPPGKIVFQAIVNGQFDIFSMNPDGTREINLTDTPGREDWPRWSPDASRILYLSDASGSKNVWTMNPDGTDKRQVTSEPYVNSAFWAADGTKVFFIDTNAKLTSINLDGSGRTQIYPGFLYTGMHEPLPSGGFLSVTSAGVCRIREMTAGGVLGATLTTGGPSPELCPALSNSGNRLAWSSQLTGNGDIYVADYTPGSVANITRVTTRNNTEESPSWSPDGRFLVFDVSTANIDRVEISTGTIVRLTDGSRPRLRPHWSSR